MAVMLPAQAVIGVRGSVGCVTYKVGRHGGPVHLRTRRGRVRSAEQIEQAGNFRRITRSWGELTDAQRAAWNEWADDYGSALESPPENRASGYQRYVGQAVMRDLAGLAPLTTPSSPGFGQPGTPNLDVLPDETGTGVSVEMLYTYPPQVGGSTVTLLSYSPVRRLGRSAYTRDLRFMDSFSLDGPQPGIGGPPLSIPHWQDHPPGTMFWAAARVVSDAGYTSRLRPFPVRQVAEGYTRAFTVRVREPDINSIFLQRFPDDMLTLTFNVSETPVTLGWDLTHPSTDTAGDVFNALASTGVLETRHLVPALASRPATDIPVFGPVRLSLRYQPFPVPVSA